MKCPFCEHELPDSDMEPEEPTVYDEPRRSKLPPEQTEHNRLVEYRNMLRSTHGYTHKFREWVWKNNLMHDPIFDLLIAVESLWNYEKRKLNLKLKEKGINGV